MPSLGAKPLVSVKEVLATSVPQNDGAAKQNTIPFKINGSQINILKTKDTGTGGRSVRLHHSLQALTGKNREQKEENSSEKQFRDGRGCR